MWTCSRCGQTHGELPFCYGTEAPYVYFAIPEAERKDRVVLDSDCCIIDGRHFFVLGRICIPVQGTGSPFMWLAWVSLSRSNFERAMSLWETPGRENETPYFGWLSTSLPYDPSTLDLPTSVITMPVGERPLIVIQAEDHPLAQQQRDGIPLQHVTEIAERLLHQ